MTWIIASLVLGLIALIGYSLYCQWRNSINIAVVVEHHAGLVTDMLNEHHIVTAVALQELQDTVNTIRQTTDATHLRQLDHAMGTGLYAANAWGNDQAIFDTVDALVKDLEVAKAQGRYAPSTEGNVQPRFDTVDTLVQDLETSKAQVPAVDPAAWGGPEQAVPEDPWKNAR